MKTKLLIVASLLAPQLTLGQPNVKVKVTEGALTKLVQALGARGAGKDFTWSVQSASVRVQTTGIALKGKLVVRPKKTLLRPVRGIPSRGLRNASRTPLKKGYTQTFSIPMSVSLSGNTLTMKLKQQAIALKGSQGHKLTTVNLAPFYKLKSKLGLNKFTVQGSSHWPQLKQMVLQRGAGHLMLSTRIDI